MSESRWKHAWALRPVEEARNLNPAYCAQLIARTVMEYNKKREAPLGIASAFLILPLTLHMQTRELLPQLASKTFFSWIAENRPMLAEFPELVNHLRPVSREALLFAICYRIISVREGKLAPGEKPIKPSHLPSSETDDTRRARSSAILLGRWFAAQENEYEILQGFGVTP